MASTGHTTLPLPEFEQSPRILVVISPYYSEIADGLLRGAATVLDAAGAIHDVIKVPGALEIPTAIKLAQQSYRYQGYIALGCVIRGETTHYETVCNDSSRGLTLLGLEGFCIGNGILTVENMEQAAVRADPDAQNKGGGAAAAALHLIAIANRFKRGAHRSFQPSENDILIAGSAQTGMEQA